jgi:hypothetical protein
MREGFRGSEASREAPQETEALKRFFPEGEATPTELVELPEDVQERLEALAMRYLSFERYVPGQFHDVQRIVIGEGDVIYAARTIKEYPEAGTEESTFVVDVKGDEIVGHGEVRYHLTNDSGYFKDKPFVGFTETDGNHRREGLGERRLRAMNALAQQKYGKPIHSDTVISEEARKLWEKLVTEGRATMYKEGKHDRFIYSEDL